MGVYRIHSSNSWANMKNFPMLKNILIYLDKMLEYPNFSEKVQKILKDRYLKVAISCINIAHMNKNKNEVFCLFEDLYELDKKNTMKLLNSDYTFSCHIKQIKAMIKNKIKSYFKR